MGFLFRRENNEAARRERQDAVERRMAEGFRTLAELLRKAAEVIDARRLERGGHRPPDHFLERSPSRERTDK